MATIDKVSGVSFTDFLSVDDISSSNIAAIDGVLAPATGSLLLDTAYGSGAEAAYSVRKLRAAYTGAAIQVQDTVGGATSEIGFDVNNNLDTATLLAIAGTTELRVSIWYDQSGNGNNARQSTVINRPIIVSAGGAIVKNNGKPMIQSNSLTTGLVTTATGVNNSTFFGLLETNPSVSKVGTVFNGGSPTSDYLLLLEDGSASTSFNVRSGTPTTYVNGSPGSFTRNSIFDFASNGSLNSVVNYDGSSYTYEFGWSTNTAIGMPSMQEAIIYPSDKSGTDQASIESNIGNYFTQNTPILDTYTGAQAAYSLRKLRTAYAGSAIQVQDNVGSATRDIGFDVFGELNTVQLASYGGSNNVFVSKWYDQSGNGNDAEQTSSSSRPKIYDGTTGVVTENGKAAVENVLSGAQGLNIPSFTINLSNFTCTLVSKFYSDSSTNGRPIMINGDTSPNFDYRYNQFNIARNTFRLGTSTVESSFNQLSYTSSTNLQLHTITPTNGYVDGTSVGTFGTAGEDLNLNPTFNYLTSADIGRDRGTHANTSEVIIWTADQSNNRTGIESNINTFYDIFTPTKDPLLLNSFPGSAAAYSLRKLGSSYSGSAVLVQDNVGGAPKAIAFDSSNNLDSAELIAYGGINDVFVSVFYDQSGNGNDLIQISTSVRPKIYDGSTQSVVVNNTKASLSFAAGDFMADTLWNGASTSYIFNVLQSNGSESSPRIAVDIGSTTEYYGLGINGNSGASSAGISSLAQVTNGVPIGVTRGLMWDAMQSQNVLTVSGDFSSWTGGFGLTRSGQKMYEFGQEFIIYNADKSSVRTGIESNIGNYYGLVLAKLLDAYSGAKAGYSLRLLSNSYTGSAIQVQDNALGSTQDIGFDSNGNLDTAALAAYGGSNDVFVSKWYDQSGNGNDASQNTSSARPKVYDGSTGSVILENGKPAVEFDGSSTYFPLSISGLNINSITVNTVARSNNNSSNRMQFTLGTDTNVRFWNYYQSGFNRFYYGPGSPNLQYGSVDTNQHLFSFIAGSTAGAATMFKDSVAAGSSLTLQSGAMNTAQMRLGAYHNNGIIWSGTIQEFIVYPVDQTNNRNEIETNVNNYYSIY